MTADGTPDTMRRELEAIDAALAGEPVAPELTELGALAVALREERPVARPGFTRALDARVAVGFTRRPRAGAPRTRLRPRAVLVPGVAVSALAALVIAVAVVGGGGHDGSSSSSGSGGASSGASSSSADEGAGRVAASPQRVPVPQTGGSPRTDGRSRRLVERSAALVLVARPPQLDAVSDRILEVADRLGGFVVSASTTSTDGAGANGGGEFLLRVPAARLGEALAELSRIAHVRERRQTADDITREHVSARDRLAEHRAERRSLLGRLSTAATDAQVAAVRARLRTVDRAIERARAALLRVDNRARFANVDVTLVGDRHAGAGGGQRHGDATWTPADAARDALRILEVAAGLLLVALAVGVPVGLVVVLGVMLARLAARRGRERALDAV